jgi:hypothetical protein
MVTVGLERCQMKVLGLKSARMFRALRRGDRVISEAMTSHSIYAVVTENAVRLGLKLAPHDFPRPIPDAFTPSRSMSISRGIAKRSVVNAGHEQVGVRSECGRVNSVHRIRAARAC